VKPGDVLTVGATKTYYLNTHREQPGDCAKEPWLGNTTQNVLSHAAVVKVLEVARYKCAGGVELWARVEPNF
jgi:hypothetical protein